MSIIIMGSFIFQHNSNEKANIQKVPVSSSDLMVIVNQIVSHAEASEDGTLSLHFDNEKVLMILDGSRQYESYMINIGDKEIIV